MLMGKRVHQSTQASPRKSLDASTDLKCKKYYGDMYECVEKMRVPIPAFRQQFLNPTTLLSHEIFAQLNELYITTI